jgi:large subunit ribosomal protein L33
MPGRRRHQGPEDRIEIALACSECDTRNYKTTRKPDQLGRLEKKKFCPTCKHHTVHKETK